MTTGDSVYVQVGFDAGRRVWLIGEVVRVNRRSVTVAMELADGTTERHRIPVSDLRPCGPVRLGAVTEPARSV